MAGPQIVLTPIKPGKIRPDKLRLRLLNAMRKEGTQQRRLLRQTVSSWQGAKPDFKTDISLAGGDIAVRTEPTGGEGRDKWIWLDQGTRIRWALMSSDWQSKTTPGRLGSGRGRGRAVVVGRRAMQQRRIAPRPGIQARKWSEQVQKMRTRPFQRDVEQEFARFADEMFDAAG
jgi:hypothetical protein